MITPSYGLTSTERVLPRMALDFTTGVLDPRVTVARALNTATRVNASGFIEIVNANLPRFDYDPITLAPKGLLIEESRTNLLRYSAQLEIGAWGKTRATITANATVAPDGASTADKIVEDATASSTHFITQVIAFTAGTTYVLSAYVKADERNWFDFQLPSSIMGTIRNAFFDVSNGTLGTVTSGVTAAITFAGSGWYRCSLTFTPTASASVSFAFLLADADNSISYSGDGTSGLFVWGAQLEAGAFATSYIPTTTTSLTRNADTVAMTGTNFSDWYNSTQGTFSAQYSVVVNSTFVFSAVNSATPTTEVMYLRYVGSQHQGITVTGGATVSTVFDGTGLNVVNNVKTAFAYKASAYGIRTNGGALSGVNSNTTSGALPSGINKLVIGANQTGTAAFLNGCIAKLNYYNISLLNAELSAVSK